ncbi:MAG: hypothetical protein WA624_20120, partial [Methylocella sp.]
ASAFAADDRQVQARAIPPRGDDVEASPANAKADALEAPESAPSDLGAEAGQSEHEVPAPLEPAPSRTNELARPKRSGWWQRARAS